MAVTYTKRLAAPLCGMLLAAAAPAAELEPLAIIEMDAYGILSSRAATFLQTIGVPEGLTVLNERIGELLLTPNLVGVDTEKPANLFLLAADPPEEAPVPVSFVPLKLDGTAYLKAMEGLYEHVEASGGVRVFTGAKSPAYPEPLYVAVAEAHALSSMDMAGLRWLARQRRDRTMPRPAVLDAPVRATIRAPQLGLLLELIAALQAESGRNGEALPAASLLTSHVQGFGGLCGELATLDVGLAADGLGLTLTVRATAPAGSGLERAFAAASAPEEAVDRVLPDTLLAGSASGALSALRGLSAASVAWLEKLALDTTVLGVSVCPGREGWLPELLPQLTGQHVAGFMPSPTGRGIARVRAFGLRDPAAGAATLARLAAAASPDGRAKLRMLNQTIPVYRLPASSEGATNRTGLAGSVAAMSRLLGATTVEASVIGGQLLIVEAGEGAFDLVAARLAARETDGVSIVERSRRPFIDHTTNTVVAGSHLAPVAIARTLAESIPGITPEQLAQFPKPGGGTASCMLREGKSLTWMFRLPSGEGFALRKLGGLDAQLVQELLTQLVLEQFQTTTPDERERGGRQPRPYRRIK